jgi:hypothetical protein
VRWLADAVVFKLFMTSGLIFLPLGLQLGGGMLCCWLYIALTLVASPHKRVVRDTARASGHSATDCIVLLCLQIDFRMFIANQAGIMLILVAGVVLRTQQETGYSRATDVSA